MPAAYAGEVGQLATGAGSASKAIPVTRAPAVGSLLILRVTNTNQPLTGITDSKGNSWFIEDQRVISASWVVAWTLQNVGKLTTADTITLTFGGNIFGFAAVVDEFTGVTSGMIIKATTTGTATTARQGGVTSSRIRPGVVIGAFGLSNLSETTLTPGAGYSSPTTPFRVQSAPITAEMIYKIVTGDPGVVEQATATGGANASVIGLTIFFREDPGGPWNDPICGTHLCGEAICGAWWSYPTSSGLALGGTPPVIVTVDADVVPSSGLALGATAPGLSLADGIVPPSAGLALGATAPAIYITSSLVIPSAGLALGATVPDKVGREYLYVVACEDIVLSADSERSLTLAPAASTTIALDPEECR
jgi:hypothetical protein